MKQYQQLLQDILVKELNSLQDIENLTIEDFVLSDYKSYPKIIAELKTGL